MIWYPVPRNCFADKRLLFWWSIGLSALLDWGAWALRGASHARFMHLQACSSPSRERLHVSCPPGGVSTQMLQDAASDARWSDIWFWAVLAAIVLAVLVWELWRHTSWGDKLRRLYYTVRDLIQLNSGDDFDTEYDSLTRQYTDGE